MSSNSEAYFGVGCMLGVLLMGLPILMLDSCGTGGLNQACYGNETCDAKLVCIKQSRGGLRCLDAVPVPASKE